jgi:flavin reductase (DIM6/NTAB) family NADH-FMN oxidoreductase RutF
MMRATEYTAVELDGSMHVVSGHVEVDEQLAAQLEAPPPRADDEAFRAAMRVLAAGVVMVTTWHDERPWGLTISACCSVAVDPPEILISLRSTTVSCRSILASERFGVSILGAAQKPLAELGSAVGAAKFVDDYCNDCEPLESPMIADALYHLDCAVASHQRVSDHSLIVGRVLHVVYPPVAPADPDPLVYFNRAFWSLGREL